MNVARWTGIIVAAAALGCAGNNAQSRPAGTTAAAQPRDADRGGGANATASNAEAASQRPSSGAGSQDPHPVATNRDDPRYQGRDDAASGNVQRPGLEGRPALPPANSSAEGGTGAATAAAAKSEIKELPEVRGQLSRISQSDITIRDQDGNSVKLKRDPQTTVDGQQNGFASLHEGDQVRASYDEKSGDKIAIDVRRADGSSSTSTTPSSSGADSSSRSTGSNVGGMNDTSTSTGGTTGSGGTSGSGSGTGTR